MTRIQKICSYLDKCKSLADVGCDHGYCARLALESGLCESVLVTDVSAKSLSKAERLLQGYIKSGKCASVCCDGLEGVPEDIEQVLIAGMGGEEIMGIFERSYLPKKFVLQPMKNATDLRRYLLSRGCSITADDIFKDGKYYFIIKGQSGGGASAYSPLEEEFGRDSLKNPLLKDYAMEEASKKRAYLQACPPQSAGALLSQLTLLEKAINYEG